MGSVIAFGAAGRLVRRVSAEAAGRDHHVIGVTRGTPSTLRGEGVEEAEGDVTDLAMVRCLGASADVYVVTVGGPDKSVYLQAARPGGTCSSRLLQHC